MAHVPPIIIRHNGRTTKKQAMSERSCSRSVPFRIFNSIFEIGIRDTSKVTDLTYDVSLTLDEVKQTNLVISTWYVQIWHLSVSAIYLLNQGKT